MVRMYCEDCCKYMKTADPEHGICSASISYFPVEAKDFCRFLPQPSIKQCQNCERYYEDPACFNAPPDSEACDYFIDYTLSQNELLKQIQNQFYITGDKEKLRLEINKYLDELKYPWD